MQLQGKAAFQTRFPAAEDDSIASPRAHAAFNHFVSQADTAPAGCMSAKGAVGTKLPRGELQLMKVPNYTGLVFFFPPLVPSETRSSHPSGGGR